MTIELIHQLISFIDLTTLDSKDTEESVLKLVEKANNGIDGTKPAAICVFPNFADLIAANTDLPVAVVAGCFPTGQTLLAAKINEIKLACQTKANEIDMVINRGKVLEGDYTYLTEEIKQSRSACNKHLKVILETGELDEVSIRLAAGIAIKEGADFIKTSTGKSEVGATLEAARIMCEEIKDWHTKTGKKVGFKPSGGIRTFEDAMSYYQIVEEILGEEWLNPKLFRIGASSLFDNLKTHLEKI